MKTISHESLEGDRIGRLEDAVRHQRILLAVALLAVAWLVLAGAAGSEKTINANSFVVQDANGRTRATLSMGPAGGPVLALYNQEGKIQADLSVVLDHPQLNLYRKGAKTAAQIAIGTDDNPGLWMLDDAGRERLVLLLKGDQDDPVLTLSGADRSKLLAAVLHSNQPALVILNSKGSPVWTAPN